MNTGLNDIVLTSFRRDDVASLSKRRHCYVPAGTLPALHWHYKVFFLIIVELGREGVELMPVVLSIFLDL